MLDRNLRSGSIATESNIVQSKSYKIQPKDSLEFNMSIEIRYITHHYPNKSLMFYFKLNKGNIIFSNISYFELKNKNNYTMFVTCNMHCWQSMFIHLQVQYLMIIDNSFQNDVSINLSAILIFNHFYQGYRKFYHLNTPPIQIYHSFYSLNIYSTKLT